MVIELYQLHKLDGDGNGGDGASDGDDEDFLDEYVPLDAIDSVMKFFFLQIPTDGREPIWMEKTLLEKN